MKKLVYIVYHKYPMKTGGEPFVGLRESKQHKFWRLGSEQGDILRVLFWKPPKRHALLYATVR